MRGVSAFVIAAALLAASAAESRERFFGSFQIHQTVGACNDFDPEGEEMSARYRPAGIADNGNQTLIGTFFQNGARGYRINGKVNVVPVNPPNAGFKPIIESVDVFDGAGILSGEQIRFTSQTPRTVTAATRNITIVGEIKNFSGMTGCLAKFTMLLQKRFEDLP